MLAVAVALAFAAASSRAVLITSTALAGSVANEKRSPWDISTNKNDTRPYHCAENSGEWFNRIVFSSRSPSLEFANVKAQSVPGPTSAALLLPLPIGVGLMKRRRTEA